MFQYAPKLSRPERGGGGGIFDLNPEFEVQCDSQNEIL